MKNVKNYSDFLNEEYPARIGSPKWTSSSTAPTRDWSKTLGGYKLSPESLVLQRLSEVGIKDDSDGLSDVEISSEIGLELDEVSDILIELEMKGEVIEQDGYWRITSDEPTSFEKSRLSDWLKSNARSFERDKVDEISVRWLTTHAMDSLNISLWDHDKVFNFIMDYYDVKEEKEEE